MLREKSGSGIFYSRSLMMHSLDIRKNTYCSWLGHGEHINHPHCVVINELSQHQSHDLHWYTSTPVLQHLMNEMSQKYYLKIRKSIGPLWKKLFSAGEAFLPWAGPERKCTPVLLCPQLVHPLGGPEESKQSLFTSCSGLSNTLNHEICVSGCDEKLPFSHPWDLLMKFKIKLLVSMQY